MTKGTWTQVPLQHGHNIGTERPAVVVKDHDDGTVDVCVFTAPDDGLRPVEQYTHVTLSDTAATTPDATYDNAITGGTYNAQSS